jgi:hypothetical protein
LSPAMYGIFWGNPEPYAPMRNTGMLAHRLLWLIVNGPIPDDHLHHLCGVRLCVRPDHLTPLSIVDHQAIHHVSDRCSNGHEWTPENTYYRKDNGKRQCRACKATTQRRRYADMAPEQKSAENYRSSQRRRKRRKHPSGDKRLQEV